MMTCEGGMDGVRMDDKGGRVETGGEGDGVRWVLGCHRSECDGIRWIGCVTGMME